MKYHAFVILKKRQNLKLSSAGALRVKGSDGMEINVNQCCGLSVEFWDFCKFSIGDP